MPPLSFPPAMRRLINELSKLPSIGEKSATRLAHHLLTHDERDALLLAEAIKDALEQISLCSECFFLAEEPLCAICHDSSRLASLICVVEKPADVIAIERSGGFRGRYHVLHGLWSPLRGVAPEQTKIGALLERVSRGYSDAPMDPAGKIEELLIATSTTVEGDATALYIANSLDHLPVKITRIAQGLPKGGELEYADEVTLNHAILGRRQMS
jgi:recombination protein RecR